MIRYSSLSGAMLCLLLAGACSASQEPDTADQSKFRQTEQEAKDSEMVEITIRLPDGRVIKRKERRIASKVDSDHPINRGERPPVVKGDASSRNRNGEVIKLDADVSGGSNSASTNTGGGGGGGGGGGSSGAGGGGGGSGSSTTPPPAGGGHSGGTDNAAFQPVQPDLDFTVRLYAWDNTGDEFEHIQEAIRTDPVGKTPAFLAERVALRVQSQPHEKVVLRLWKEFHPGVRHPFDTSNPRELIERGGFSEGVIEYWREFAIELKGRGVEPDYIILDQEEGISYWEIPVSERREFFGELLDPTRPLVSSLPSSMRGITVDQFMNYRNGVAEQAVADYQQFAKEFRANFLRRVISEPFNEVYGRDIHISNYWDVIAGQGFPIDRFYDSPMQEANVGGISAPVAYLEFHGQAGTRYRNTEKDQRWNRLIDVLNRLRSTAQPGLTTPWIAPPGYGRYGADTWARSEDLDEENWLWETKMSHMLAMGIDTYILWNPMTRFNPNAVVSDNWMDQWHSEHLRVVTPQLRSLGAIPLDADRIVTNGVVTTYEEYVEMMNIDP